ncbi:MAG: DUF3800 domain-containing protein [Pseudomonadota bacterium]
MTNKVDDSQFSLFENEAPTEASKSAASAPSGKFSNFIVYVDESGDHSLQNVYPEYPLFVLAFCVFYKRHYAEHVVPALEKFKFNNFGHDLVILHENEIRKEKGKFLFPSRQDRIDFMDSLTGIIEQSNFILISCVIRKDLLRLPSGATPPNPYHIALGFCLETLYEFLQEKGQDDKQTHVVVECRGKKEDAELELEFRRICDGANRLNRQLPFDIILADKKANSAGLQLADLVARPIGLSVLRPNQGNRPFEILKKKFFCSGGRENVGEGYEGWGLKIFPPPESERPR